MKKILLFAFVTFSMLLSAQNTSISQKTNNWADMMQDPNANFYDIQKAFYSYWDGKEIEKGKGYKVFKRWEHYMEPRVYPSGDIKLPSQSYENFNKWYKTASINTNKSASGDWSFIGPVGKPVGGGAGRINFVRFNPTNSNIIFVGAPDGGLWKTTNGGTSWTTNTDQLDVIGCSDLAINPSNDQIMYLATGDGDGGDTYSTGILKSTDGGLTWNTTGLAWGVSLARRISKILINPSNPNILLVASTQGVFRSTDAGANWSSTSPGSFKDMEFKPGDPNTVYAVGTIFRKSIDGGVTWTTTNSGVPLSNIRRISMAVTPANSQYVYLLYGRNDDGGLLGVYRSTNSGTSFTQHSSDTPNLLGWQSDASDAGGQAWYDLTIACSPTNANEVIIGGVNTWKSTDGGFNFNLMSHWWGDGAPYVHADHHDLVYLSGTTIFDGNDGGLFKSTNNGASWTDISSNLGIAQQYRIGISSSTEDFIVAGHQDNGTNLLSSGTWDNVYGGDGMDCFVDRTNNNIIVGSYVYGDYYRSTNGGASFSDITTGIPVGSGSASWLSVIHQDPVNAQTYYAGGRQSLYKTTNSGSSWTALGTPTSGSNIIEFAIAPSNNQIIYAVTSSRFSKSINGGVSWTNISTGLPTGSASLTNLTISDDDPNIVFATFSGYSASNKVFKSIDGGISWINISSGLPNVACNTIVYDNNSTNDDVYVGTDVGVYYLNSTLSSWVFFSTGLPRVNVSDLEIFYPTRKLKAATFGRGTWTSDLFSSALSPVADFTASSNQICDDQSITFTNSSLNNPSSYEWLFPGGTPSSSTATNPTITYNTSGTYDVRLIAINSIGRDTLLQIAFIDVIQGQAIPFTEDFVNPSFPYANWSLTDLQSNGTWAQTTDAGNTPSAGDAVMFDNFSYNDIGFNDEFILPKLNLSSSQSASLSFDVAYAPYDGTYYDSLEVLVSIDCGNSYTSIYIKGNMDLATSGAVAGSFTPAANEWRTETVDLSAFLNSANAMIKFKNIAGYGNRLFIDNININGVPGVKPTAAFTQNTSLLCTGQSIAYTNTSTDNPTSYKWNFAGGTPATSTSTSPSVQYATAGVYDVQLIAYNNFGSDTITMTNQVTVNQTPTTPTISASGPLSFCQGGSVTLTSSNPSGNLWSNASNLNAITVNSSGVFTVTTSLNGCTSNTSASVTVSVNAIPNAPTITANGPTTFCQGQTVVLSSSQSSGNLWSTGASTQQITVSASTNNISATVTTNGCTSVASNSISVTVNPLPTVNLPNFSSICDTISVLVLNSGTPSGGTYSGTGVSGTNFNPSVAGIGTHVITYTFIDNNACQGNAQSSIVVNDCPYAGLTDEILNGFIIYPNPTNDYVIVKGEKLLDYKQIEILANDGKLIKTILIKESEIKIDLSKFAVGNYQLKISNDNSEIIQKIQVFK